VGMDRDFVGSYAHRGALEPLTSCVQRAGIRTGDSRKYAAVTVSSALVAFGFAYFRFPGRGVLFGLVLGPIMLPGVVTIVPVNLVWNAVVAQRCFMHGISTTGRTG
jgi:hypothetical protein